VVEIIEGLADLFAGIDEVGSRARRREAFQADRMPVWMEEQAAREDRVRRSPPDTPAVREQRAWTPGAEERPLR
jgi:hypothetical protein